MTLRSEALKDGENTEALAAAVGESLRRGELPVDRVRAAARCGNAAARRLFAEEPLFENPYDFPGYELLSEPEQQLFLCDCFEEGLSLYPSALPESTDLIIALGIVRRVARGQEPREALREVSDLLTSAGHAYVRHLGKKDSFVECRLLGILSEAAAKSLDGWPMLHLNLSSVHGSLEHAPLDENGSAEPSQRCSCYQRRLARYLLGEAGYPLSLTKTAAKASGAEDSPS